MPSVVGAGAGRRRDVGTAILLAALAVAFVLVAARGVIYHGLDAAFGNRPLNAVRSWHYQLTSLDLEPLAKADADLIVTEYSANVEPYRAWTSADVARLKQRPDGRRRIVL